MISKVKKVFGRDCLRTINMNAIFAVSIAAIMRIFYFNGTREKVEVVSEEETEEPTFEWTG
jgi:hypothetical protein